MSTTQSGLTAEERALLAEIKALEEKATPGPWRTEPDDPHLLFGDRVHDKKVMDRFGLLRICSPPYKEDAEFIAASCNASPLLRAALERLDAQLAAEKRRADAAEDVIHETCRHCGFENCKTECENADCAIYKWRGPQQEGAGEDAAD